MNRTKNKICILLSVLILISILSVLPSCSQSPDISDDPIDADTVFEENTEPTDTKTIADDAEESIGDSSEVTSEISALDPDTTTAADAGTAASTGSTDTVKHDTLIKPETKAPESTANTKPTVTAAPDTSAAKPKSVEEYVDSLTLEEKIAQMFFARCIASTAEAQAREYSPGGFILFAVNFQNQTPDSIKRTVNAYQKASSVPMLIGVDEEGGTVVRVSKFPAFRSSPFMSPADVYASGGLNALTSDTKEKDALLKSLGINVNLAPVCDIASSPDDYIYKRTLGKNAKETSEGIKAIVTQMTKDNTGSVLKHFPGYGSNVDTHTGIAVDERSLDSFRQNDFLPFIAGIGAGANGVMVNHNIIKCIDPNSPASLSRSVHSVLRNELNFGGVIMTDDLSMSAITKYTNGQNAAVAAVLAGNDMIISSDFVNQYNAVLSAVRAGTVSEAQIRASVIRIIRWKVLLGLISF